MQNYAHLIAERKERRNEMVSETERRAERQRALTEIVRRRAIRRQEELVARLAERGFEVTQSSVSRDLRQLGVAKVGGRYVVPQRPAGSPDELAEIAHALHDAKPAGPHLTVVFTAVGAAQAVGIALDRARWSEIVGTVAGDDTVFVASAGAHEQTRLLHRLHALIAQSSSETSSETSSEPPR
jgi:transcriptional regulator of arginine metabolism